VQLIITWELQSKSTKSSQISLPSWLKLVLDNHLVYNFLISSDCSTHFTASLCSTYCIGFVWNSSKFSYSGCFLSFTADVHSDTCNFKEDTNLIQNANTELQTYNVTVSPNTCFKPFSKNLTFWHWLTELTSLPWKVTQLHTKLPLVMEPAVSSLSLRWAISLWSQHPQGNFCGPRLHYSS
jgi:hypothetical protein